MFLKLSDQWTFYNVAVLFGGGSGGGGESTSYTSNLPEYAEPYYTEMMGKSEAVSNLDYVPYEGPRIADWSDAQLTSQAGIDQLAQAGNPLLSQAGDYATMSNYLNLDQATQPDPLSSTYGGPQGYNPNEFASYDVDPSAQFMDPNGFGFVPDDVGTLAWNDQVRDQYMSPYMDAVVQRQQDDALIEHQRQQMFRDTDAVNAGAFSGDRRFVSDSLAEENLLDRQDMIQKQGLQDAYTNAQAMFTTDMARRLQGDISNQQAGLQAGLAGEDYRLRSGLASLDSYTRSEMANQAAAQDAANLREQSRQFGSNLFEQGSQFGADLDYAAGSRNEELRLQGLQQLMGGTGLTGSLGLDDQNAYLSRMASLNDVGNAQMARQQDVYDQGYEDFLNQRDYERQSLQWLSSQLQGVPVSTQGNVVKYSPTPSMLSQMVGSGLAGLGTYNAYSNA